MQTRLTKSNHCAVAGQAVTHALAGEVEAKVIGFDEQIETQAALAVSAK